MDLESLLEVFKFLSAPFDDPSMITNSGNDGLGRSKDDGAETGPEVILQRITEHCLKHVDFLESSKNLFHFDRDSYVNCYSSWKLTCIILSLLAELKDAIERAEMMQTEEEKAIDVLSIQSQIIVQKSVEIVVGFGIVPYLLPGVGVPEKLRKVNPCVSPFLSDVRKTAQFEQFVRLSHTLEILLTCSTHSSLNILIVPKYSSDILGGLLQVCKSPIARPKPGPPQQKDALSMEQYNHAMLIRKNLQSLSLSTFYASIPKSTLINSLFLVGAADKPRWIGSSCNDMLCEFMLSSDGLIIVASTMVESSSRFDSWKLMRIIASLMKLSIEKSSNLNFSDIVRTLSEQCIRMICQNQHVDSASNVKSGDNELSHTESTPKLPYDINIDLARVGLFCGFALMSINFDYAKSVFWNRLFNQLLLLNECADNVCGAKNIVDITQTLETITTIQAQHVVTSVTLCELLLSVMKPLNISLPLKLLQPVWSLFLQIFVACEVYLKKPVQESNVAAVAEDLHKKLKDIIITLFEIYGSGSGNALELSIGSSGSKPKSVTDSFEPVPNNSTSGCKVDCGKSEAVDICEFILMLLLNEESYGTPILNTFELTVSLNDNSNYVEISRVHQELISSSSDYNKVYEEYLNVTCQCLSSSILKNDKLKGMWSPLIYQLLSWGTKRHAKGKTHGRAHTFKSDELPTRIEGNNIAVKVDECRKFITFKLLGELANEEIILEQFGNSENPNETLNFLELLVDKFTEEACTSVDNSNFDSSQLLTYALGIVGAIVDAASAASLGSPSSGNNPGDSSTGMQNELAGMWDDMQVFIPNLRKLSQCTQVSLSQKGIPAMASELLLRIGSRGSHNNKSGQNKRNELFVSRFQQAMDDASNVMVHIKGHGILELRRLVEEKDPETLEHALEILKIFQHNLTNSDSYVYLMSIQGMATFALKFHLTVVPTLIKEYNFTNCISGNGSAVGDHNASSSEESAARNLYRQLDAEERVETQMKVGEVLVKVIQKLGQLAPSYRVPLTNAFFELVRDEEPLIRASALSNLGELCHLLKFSLGVILTEVWYCVESILNTEKDIHVRRAALHLVVLLLKGVASDLATENIIRDNVIAEHLRDVRRYVTRTEQTEADLVAKTHCQLALQELTLIARKLLTPATLSDFNLRSLAL